MSDTPRTDACVFDADLVSAVFARELERELSKANKNLESEIDGRLHFQWEIAELERENARLQMELDASCNAEELRQYRHANQFLITNQGAYERENARMKRVVGLARDAVESGAIDECYLSLLRDAVSALPNV